MEKKRRNCYWMKISYLLMKISWFLSVSKTDDKLSFVTPCPPKDKITFSDGFRFLRFAILLYLNILKTF